MPSAHYRKSSLVLATAGGIWLLSFLALAGVAFAKVFYQTTPPRLMFMGLFAVFVLSGLITIGGALWPRDPSSE